MLLVEQRIEAALPLLAKAHAEWGAPDRVDDDRFGNAPDREARFHQAKLQIAVFTPSVGEALVEAAERGKRGLPDEAVGGHELGRRETRSVALVVGRLV